MIYKQRIPTLAVAALVFGGCGSDGDEKSGDEKLAALVPDICEKILECAPGEGTQAECEEDYASYFEEELGNESEDCKSALADLYDCYVGLSCEDLVGDDPDNKCEAKDQKAVELCNVEEEE